MHHFGLFGKKAGYFQIVDYTGTVKKQFSSRFSDTPFTMHHDFTMSSPNKLLTILRLNLSPFAPTFGGLSTVVKPVGMDGLSKLTLSWSAASGVFDQYKIFIKSGGNYDFNTADASVGSGTTTYTNAGLTTDQEYCYVVRAVHQGTAQS